MKKSELKQLIRECIEEVSRPGFGGPTLPEEYPKIFPKDVLLQQLGDEYIKIMQKIVPRDPKDDVRRFQELLMKAYMIGRKQGLQ